MIDISPEMLSYGQKHSPDSIQLVMLESWSTTGAQEYSFHNLRQIHELQIKSLYHIPFPGGNWAALIPRQTAECSCVLPWE